LIFTCNNEQRAASSEQRAAAAAAAAAIRAPSRYAIPRHAMPRPAGQRQLLGGQRTKATPTNATLRGIMELFAGGTANNFICHARRYVEK